MSEERILQQKWERPKAENPKWLPLPSVNITILIQEISDNLLSFDLHCCLIPASAGADPQGDKQ